MKNVMRENGFTIAELLVGMAVGLLVLLAVTTVYINTLRTSANTLGGTRLNQEMSAIMNIMVNDIRRAGYWGVAATNFNNAEINPFNAVEGEAAGDISALRIHSNGGSGTTYNDKTYTGGVVTAASVGSCITYTYDIREDVDGDGVIEDATCSGDDANRDDGDTDCDLGILDNDEMFGFRWDGWPGKDTYSSSNCRQGFLLMRSSNNATGPNNCIAGNWDAVNEFEYDPARTGDNRFKGGIIVTNLQFSIARSSCYNASEPDGTDDGGVVGQDADALLDPTEFDCYIEAPTTGSDMGGTDGDGTGNSTVETILVDITLTAELADDPDVRATQTQSVQLRNNLIRAR